MKEWCLLSLSIFPCIFLFLSLSTEPLIPPLFLNPQPIKRELKLRWLGYITKKPVFPCKPFFQLLSWGSRTRVFIGFNFKPMLSGERSSGAMQDGLKGLLGLTLDWEGLYKPYPMRKYSIGINIAWGCSSVTIDPHAWTCRSHTPPVMSLLYIYGKIQLSMIWP